MATQTMAAKKCEEDLFCGVNRPKDPDNLTDLEKKHIPVISAPKSVKKGEKFDVEIEIGKLLEHPNEPAHFIEFVELYADHTYLGRVDFTAKRTCPTARLCVTLEHSHGQLRAYERCNLHGTWEGDTDIEVT